jgi:hypothetical protein
MEAGLDDLARFEPPDVGLEFFFHNGREYIKAIEVVATVLAVDLCLHRRECHHHATRFECHIVRYHFHFRLRFW